jgi:hypothetical protein
MTVCERQEENEREGAELTMSERDSVSFSGVIVVLWIKKLVFALGCKWWLFLHGLQHDWSFPAHTTCEGLR